MVSCKFSNQETLSVLIYGENCIYLVILMYFMQIYFHLLWSENKFTDFIVFLNFCWPYTQCELYIKTKFSEDSNSQDKTQFENKRLKSDY